MNTNHLNNYQNNNDIKNIINDFNESNLILYTIKFIFNYIHKNIIWILIIINLLLQNILYLIYYSHIIAYFGLKFKNINIFKKKNKENKEKTRLIFKKMKYNTIKKIFDNIDEIQNLLLAPFENERKTIINKLTIITTILSDDLYMLF
jgi:hypothetical protein